MKRTLNILSAMAVAAATALTVAAAPLAVLKHGAGHHKAISRTALAEQPAEGTRGFCPVKTRTLGSKGAKGLTAALGSARMASPASLSGTDGNLPQLNGVVVYADNWGYNAKPGLYALPTAGGSGFEMLVDGPYGSSVVADGRVYSVSRITMVEFDIDYPRYTIYDLETGEELLFKNYQEGNIDWSIVPVDMDIDPVSGDIYAITYNRDLTGYQLSKMNFTDATVTSTEIAGLNGNWNAIAFDAEGQLYGISKTNVVQNNYWVCVGSTLNKINKATGAVTPVGETGQMPEYPSSATIDKQSGRMFWTVSPADGTGLLTEVNMETGEATVVKSFEHSEEVVGLYAPTPAAAEGAPAKVTDLAADFAKGSLSGKVSFTAPVTLYDGTPASGTLTYEITANGTKKAEGTTSFGGSVEADVTLESAGTYEIRATVSNAAGKSPEARTTLFVGNGVPEAPEVTLSYRNGTMLLTWSEVDATVDGGYIDPSQVTYTVTRYPDGATVSTDQTTTAYSEAVAVPDTFTTYYYSVTAKYAGNSSEPANSNRVVLGDIVPPYSETFDEESCMDGWTILDVNQDRRMWMWSTMQNLRISFNQSQAMDDWAITPAIRMEAGRVYRMSFDVFCDDPTTAERIEVKMGGAPTAAAMETLIVSPTDVRASIDEPLTITATITPESSGSYFIGFHCISPADSYMLNLDNVKVESGLDAGAPSAVTNLKAVADPTGAYKATISFKTPSTTIAGGAIWQSFKKVEIWRDGELCKLYSSAEPNTDYDFTDDKITKAGSHTYTVYCFNLFGQGMPASTTVFVGTDKPAKPASATIAETAKEGEVTVGWAEVTTDHKGNAIPASKITYTIAEHNGREWTPKFEGLTGTSHTFQAAEGAQDMVQYAVFAVTEGGIGEGALTDLIPVGPAFKGLRESFPNARPTTLWGMRSIKNAEFALYDDASGIAAQDGDNGFMGMGGDTPDDQGALFSGKVSLAGMQNPGLSFHTFNVNSNNVNEIAIQVREAGAASYTTLRTVKVNEACGADEWGKVSVPLGAYAGKTIQVQFLCTIKNYPVILLDNIEIGSLADNDLAITNITAPETAKTGTGYTVAVTIANEGTKNADGYTVDLFANGIKADSKSGEPLAAGQKTTVEFACQMHALAKEPVEYYAVVNHAADEVPSNNTSGFAEVTPKASLLPAPEQLTVAAEGGGTRLSWQAPDLGKAVADEVTEDLEDADPFVRELEGWTFVDVDGAALGGFNELDGTPIPVPGLLPGSTKGSFFVCDASYERFDQSYAAHSGSKYLAALFRFDDGQTDDWAISPELDGKEQSISFFAKSFSGSYPEYIQVLYSTGSLDTKSFQPLCELTKVPSEWAPLSITLPAGAKRFAIRSSSSGSFMLMIDDITFTPAASTLNLTLAGYNVYRDGEKLNLSTLTETAYLDTEGTADHKYVVTAVYDGKGESGASNEASLNSGLDEITLNAEIYAADGHIILSGLGNAPAAIHAVDGKAVYSGKGDAKVAVAPGVYLVKAGKMIEKVVVR